MKNRGRNVWCWFLRSRLPLAVLGLLLAISCGGPRLSGTYSCEGLSLSFQNDGKVQMSSPLTLGLSIELDYKMNGNKISILSEKVPDVSYQLTMLPDGNLQSPMGILTKE